MPINTSQIVALLRPGLRGAFVDIWPKWFRFDVAWFRAYVDAATRAGVPRHRRRKCLNEGCCRMYRHAGMCDDNPFTARNG